MDYYSSSASRPRSSYRGSSYRGSVESSYRGSRGSRGSSRGGYQPRGRGGSTSSYYPKYDSSPKYSTESSKYGSSSRGYSEGATYSRRPETSYSGRDYHDDISRKRPRTDSYSSSQALYSRREDESEYRSSARYSGGHSESRSYDEPRPFKKPRPAEYKPSKPDYRVKEPLRVRSVRGRLPLRGISRRGRDNFGSRFRGTVRPRTSATASTSEILAIRRAKLLQNRLKAESSDKSKVEDKDKKAEGADGASSAAAVEKDVPGGEEKKDNAETSLERTNYFGKPFIKLVCPQCSIKCVTFKEYSAHLYAATHIQAMKNKSDDLKTTLASMRIAQREKQKEIDSEDLTSMETRSFFCLICKLNCMQDKMAHRATELHKKLKNFLMPYCRTCRMPFQSPMSYESHLCSLEHLKRKHADEEREKRIGTGVLDNFMILDSVEGGDEGDEKEEEAEKKETEEPEAKEEDLTLGAEFIRTVKVKYCEVCRTYLPRIKDTESAITRHCRTKEHLRCYLHYGNETLLEKMQEDDEEEKKKEEVKSEVKEEASEEALEGDELWAGLGKLLEESQPNDDEDEEEGGRFDRFKTNEKKENGDVSAVSTTADDEPDDKGEKNGEVNAQETAVETPA